MDIERIELPQLTIRRIAVSGMDNNVYLLSQAGEHLLIDAAAEPEAVEELLGVAGTRLRYVLTTHSHRDHIGALAAVMAGHPGAQTLAGEEDAAAITEASGVGIARRLSHGDVIGLGTLELAVIGLRGHTPGSVAVACSGPGAPAQLFTGDSLFPGGVGRTTTAKAFRSLIGDVEERIFDAYPDDTVVWPGHGLPTTLGAERPQLPEWRARGW